MTQTFCITIGDPTGIGPEIVAKVLNDASFCKAARFKVLGDIPQLHETAVALGLNLPDDELIEYVHVEGNGPGAVAYLSLEKAVEMIRRKEADALVTGPISKENLKSVGIPFEGHTEILQHLSNLYFDTPVLSREGEGWQSDMLFVFGRFRMLLLTRHVALREVSDLLTVPSVMASLNSAIRFMDKYQGIECPRICMLGVNPHAGEINGTEERDIIMPAIEQVSRENRVEISPPCAADALFREFDSVRPEYDLYVAPYHDQGLIPMKLLAGFRAVNVTIGLPFVRTSVSHGMAMDIVGQGCANATSLREAIVVARNLVMHQYVPMKAAHTVL